MNSKKKKTKKHNPKKTKQKRIKKKFSIFQEFLNIRKRAEKDIKLKQIFQSAHEWENYNIITPIPWNIYREDTKETVNYDRVSIFQKYIENKSYRKKLSKFIVYEDKKILVFVPHRNDKRISNNISESNNYTKINSSRIHYLAIPKKRLWNIITSTSEHLPILKHCRKVLNKLIRLALRSDDVHSDNYEILNPKSLSSKLKNMKDSSKIRNTMHYGQNLSNYVSEKFHDNSIDYSVHLFPMATVYWLHIHGFVESMNTIKNTVLYYKQLNLNQIINYFEKKKINKEKNIELCNKDIKIRENYFKTLKDLNINLSVQAKSKIKNSSKINNEGIPDLGGDIY